MTTKQRIQAAIKHLLKTFPSETDSHQVRSNWITAVKDQAKIWTTHFPEFRKSIDLMNRRRYDQLTQRLQKGGSSGDRKSIEAKKTDLAELLGLISG